MQHMEREDKAAKSKEHFLQVMSHNKTGKSYLTQKCYLKFDFSGKVLHFGVLHHIKFFTILWPFFIFWSILSPIVSLIKLRSIVNFTTVTHDIK